MNELITGTCIQSSKFCCVNTHINPEEWFLFLNFMQLNWILCIQSKYLKKKKNIWKIYLLTQFVAESEPICPRWSSAVLGRRISYTKILSLFVETDEWKWKKSNRWCCCCCCWYVSIQILNWKIPVSGCVVEKKKLCDRFLLCCVYGWITLKIL